MILDRIPIHIDRGIVNRYFIQHGAFLIDNLRSDIHRRKSRSCIRIFPGTTQDKNVTEKGIKNEQGKNYPSIKIFYDHRVYC